MHRLDRNAVAVPECLVPTDPPRRYNDLRGHEKSDVRSCLLAIQNRRCAYCERRTGAANDDGHIEHFRNQTGHEHLETEWNNLFWSCNDEKTCGKHKDKCDRANSTSVKRAFDPADIIKPCTDDPDHFMMFVSDGTIACRNGLDSNQLRRYSETLRVFQLADSPLLRQSREDAVRPYVGALNTLRKVEPELFGSFIDGELAGLETMPFATAIRHFLESNRP